MRSSRLTSATNWRYAFGEITLIVIGVSLALAASSWYEMAKDNRQGKAILVDLRETLRADLENLKAYEKATIRRANNLSSLIEHLDMAHSYSPQLKEYFKSLNSWDDVDVRSAPFEALKNRGLNLISSDELRNLLISLYEDEYPALDRSSLNAQIFVVSKSLPYFLENFARDKERNWVPEDYDAIVDDNYLMNLASWRENTTQNFLLPRCAAAINRIGEILAMIDSELE